jgi:hypothetical protein
MLFKTTFNSISVISWRSVILVKEIGVPGDNHWHVASHWQTLSHNVVSSTSHCTGSYKSKYHLIRPQQPPDKILSYSRTNLFIGSILCYNLFRLYVNKSFLDIFQTTIDSWAEVTSRGSREAWYRVIRILPQWQISLWHFRCLRMGKIDIITYKYVIITCNILDKK